MHMALDRSTLCCLELTVNFRFSLGLCLRLEPLGLGLGLEAWSLGLGPDSLSPSLIICERND